MTRSVFLSSMVLLTFAWMVSSANAQIVRPVKELQDVTVTEHLNEQIPLGLKFVDDHGRSIQLKQVFDGELPVVLTLNYSDCPMLCSLQLQGMVAALKEISLEPGRDYKIVTVSINPLETTAQSRLAKQRYLGELGRGNDQGWTFLTGREAEIQDLAEAVGFGYRYVPERKEYAHAAVFMVCTPEGVLSRYIYGVQFVPQTVQLSLVEAGEGRIGSTLDQVLLYCFHYDATSGSYTLTAVNLMKIGGAVTVVAVVLFVLPWRRKWAVASDATAKSIAISATLSEPLP